MSETPADPDLKPEPPPLPPVQPPSATFILQLFLIPMVIVSIIVVIWLMFSWVAHMGSNPRDLVSDLQTLNEDSWRKAFNLANLLRNPENDHLKDDPELCRALAGLLQAELQSSDSSVHRNRLRVYLCRALGEFRSPEGLAVLLQAAAGQQGNDQNIDVRLAALEALAVLSSNLGPDALSAHPRALPVIIECSRAPGASVDAAQERKLREMAAFTLGVVGGDQARERLRQLLDDPHPDVRYNAATGLARHGDEAAATVLLEMLEPDNPRAVRYEETATEKQLKRNQVLLNGVRGTAKLALANPQADFSRLQPALQALTTADVPRRLQLEAREALNLVARETVSAGR